MRNMKKMVLASMLACLAFSLAFSGTITASVDLPAYKASDFWKYYVRSHTEMMSPNDTFYFNQTVNYSVEGEETVNVGGTLYSVYNVSVSLNGSAIIRCGKLIHFSATTMNGTYYIKKSDLSKIRCVEVQNRTATPGNWTWSRTERNYTSEDMPYAYPVTLGKNWYNNYSYDYKTLTISCSWGAIKYGWDNSTSFANNSCVCDLDETIGAYPCLRVKVQDADNSSNEPTYDWVSADAGSTFVQRRNEQFTPNADTWECWSLASGIFNGNPLSPIPLPPVPEFAILLVPLSGIIAFFFVFRAIRFYTVNRTNY